MTTTQATNIVDYKNGAATIDADGHVNETGHLGDYIDPAHRSILELPPGTVRALDAASGGLPHAGDVGPDGARALGDPGRERRRRPPRDMDAEGIDVAVLYPTAVVGVASRTPRDSARCAARTTTGLRDYCAADADAALRCRRRPAAGHPPPRSRRWSAASSNSTSRR